MRKTRIIEKHSSFNYWSSGAHQSINKNKIQKTILILNIYTTLLKLSLYLVILTFASKNNNEKPMRSLFFMVKTKSAAAEA